MLIWKTQEAPSADFRSAWDAVLRSCMHAHFALERRWLEWEAGHGRHAIAAVEADGPEPIIVAARQVHGVLISGWPWRWQAGRASGADATLGGLSLADARRASRMLTEAGGGARVRMYVPIPAGRSRRTARAGTTTLLPLTADLKARPPSGNKRREARKAAAAGWVVEAATTADEFRGYAELQLANERRRRGRAAALPDDPAPGESWREWEHPWMWLLVAKRDGVIGAGSGFGRSAGGMVDYRANASTTEARDAGANALLAVEAARLAGQAGHRFMNWGGATTFKRSLGGDTLPTWEWLGGGGAWALPNAIESLWKAARSEAAAGVKALRRRGGASRKG